MHRTLVSPLNVIGVALITSLCPGLLAGCDAPPPAAVEPPDTQPQPATIPTPAPPAASDPPAPPPAGPGPHTATQPINPATGPSATVPVDLQQRVQVLQRQLAQAGQAMEMHQMLEQRRQGLERELADAQLRLQAVEIAAERSPDADPQRLADRRQQATDRLATLQQQLDIIRPQLRQLEQQIADSAQQRQQLRQLQEQQSAQDMLESMGLPAASPDADPDAVTQ